MKNFDETRTERRSSLEDRTFQLGGEVFVIRQAIKPEWMVPYEDLDPVENTSGDFVRTIDDLICAVIEPNDDAVIRYRALREREEDPVDIEDLHALVRWMIETATGRPTGQRDGSSPSRTSTGTESTVDSSSPVSLVG